AISLLRLLPRTRFTGTKRYGAHPCNAVRLSRVYLSMVVIVGGGLSGLTAAVQLSRLGIRCVLFEDSTELGGRARTDGQFGFDLNYGPHRLYEDGPAVSGLRSLQVPVDAAARGPNGGFAVCQGRKQTLPVGLCSLMTTGLFGSQAKREIARV